MSVRLSGNFIDQLCSQLGNVRKFAPRARQCGSKLSKEVLHTRVATGDAIGLEQTHLRPAQTKAVAHDLIDLLSGSNVVSHQPQGLTP